jgi:cyclic pyranopterin monophosphate synthase
MRPALTHRDTAIRPTMLDVEVKAVTLREATAEARVRLPVAGARR